MSRDHRGAAQAAVQAAQSSGAQPGTPAWQQAASTAANAVLPGSGAVVGPIVHALSDLFS